MFTKAKAIFSNFYNSSLAERLKNRYLLSGLLFIIWMTFLDTHSFKIHYKLNKEISQTRKSIQYFKTEIERDRELLKQLESDPEMLEKFAREQYFFKRPEEKIFVVVISE